MFSAAELLLDFRLADTRKVSKFFDAFIERFDVYWRIKICLNNLRDLDLRRSS